MRENVRGVAFTISCYWPRVPRGWYRPRRGTIANRPSQRLSPEGHARKVGRSSCIGIQGKVNSWRRSHRNRDGRRGDYRRLHRALIAGGVSDPILDSSRFDYRAEYEDAY